MNPANQAPKLRIGHTPGCYMYTVELQRLEHLRPWKFVRNMGSSSHWGLVMTPVQEANSDSLGKFFLHNDCILSVLDEAILTQHTIPW